MDLAFFFGAMALFFVSIFIREAFAARKREKKFIQSLYTNYGEIPQKEYSLERYERIASYYKKHVREGQIDDITWNDLNMDEIFKRMNDTFSASGEEYLYYTLRNIGTNKEELTHLEAVISFFENNQDERVKIRYLMKQLGHTGKYSLYDYIDNLDFLGERSNRKHILLNVLFIPFLLLIPVQASVGVIGLVALIIYNIMSYFKEKNEIEPYVISFAYIMRLIYMAEKLVRVKVPVCEQEWQAIREYSDALKGMKNGAFIVLSSGRANASGNPLEILLDYLRMVFHLDLMQFNKMLAQLRKNLDAVDGLITQVGYVETAIAIGAFRKSLPRYCVPELEEQSFFVVDDAYHPLIENAVTNSISTDKGVLLTGSNASGKSTFLKTVALNAIFAQTIHTCTAGKYGAPHFAIFSSMSLRDNLEGGESYYIVEIRALKRILDEAKQSGRRVLCFVDEVLRGTNTVERIAASSQILKSLSGNHILCFAATHDIELTELLKDDFHNYHFEEDIREGDVFFNYKLQPGKATTRNAIKLLEIMGYAPEIVAKATNQAQRFVQTGVWE